MKALGEGPRAAGIDTPECRRSPTPPYLENYLAREATV
jgi:hypothetical protein